MREYAQKEDKKAWTKKQMEIIIEAAYQRKKIWPYTEVDYIGYAIEFLFLTGMRVGELVAFKWSNVAEDCSTISIEDTYQSKLGKDKGDVKNNKPRELPCSPRAKRILQELKRVKTSDCKYVFENGEGGRLLDDGLQKAWHGRPPDSPKPRRGIVTELVKKGILPQYLKLHSTRATFISNQIQAGFDVKTVADWVSDNPETILKSYCSKNESAVPVD